MNATIEDQPLTIRPLDVRRDALRTTGGCRPPTSFRLSSAVVAPPAAAHAPNHRRTVCSRRAFLRTSLRLAGLCLLAGCGVHIPTAVAGGLLAPGHVRLARGEPVVAAYYYPQYHRDPRNDVWHGPNWTEWDLVREARPRYPGHGQPIVPAWGYFDQSNPTWAAREIDLAADHHITSFIYDWYWFEDGPFLHTALERGFLRAPNCQRLTFALMWANHDWRDYFPATDNPQLLASGRVSRASFDRLAAYVIDRYFTRPNYLTIEGEPYFSIYEINTFIDGLGGREAAVRALDGFRRRTRRAGFPGLHLNVIDTSFGEPLEPQRRAELTRLHEELGVSSLGAYAWAAMDGEARSVGLPRVEYAEIAEQSCAAWEFGLTAPAPCHLNVGMGWDPSPRMAPDLPYAPRGYPWTAVVEGNTPAAFGSAVHAARNFLMRPDVRQKVLTVNAWNEWTEGSYLLPDQAHGKAYLSALASALARASSGGGKRIA